MASGPALFGASTYPHLVSSARWRRRGDAQRALSAAGDRRREGLAGEDEANEAVHSAFARQQTGALELLLPPLLHSIRSPIEPCPPGVPGGAGRPYSTAPTSRDHARVSGRAVSRSPRKRVLNRHITHTTHTKHTVKTCSARTERDEIERRGEERRHQRCERESEERETASVLRRRPQPPVIVASTISFFLSRSRQATKPRRRLRWRRQPVQHRCALPQPY